MEYTIKKEPQHFGWDFKIILWQYQDCYIGKRLYRTYEKAEEIAKETGAIKRMTPSKDKEIIK